MTDTIYIWKFIIPSDRWVDDPEFPGRSWSGYAAACVARTGEEAKVAIEEYAAGNGLDARWLSLAKVVRLPVAPGTFIVWSQV